MQSKLIVETGILDAYNFVDSLTFRWSWRHFWLLIIFVSCMFDVSL